MTTATSSYRTERDPLGEKHVPADALFGVQTLRAKETFQISKLRMHPELITAFAEIKRAAADANLDNKQLDEKIGRGIITAADEIIDRKSTRLNSSHSQISYAVFCLKKKKIYS